MRLLRENFTQQTQAKSIFKKQKKPLRIRNPKHFVKAVQWKGSPAYVGYIQGAAKKTHHDKNSDFLKTFL